MLRVTFRALICVALLILGMLTASLGLSMTREASTVNAIIGFLVAFLCVPSFLTLSFQLGALWTDLKNLYKPKQPQ